MTDGDPEGEARSDGQPGDTAVEHPGKKYERIADRYGEPVDAGEPEIVPESPGPADPASAAGGDAPAELQARFWALVLVFNGALLGLSLGAMFVVFENDWTLGLQLLAGGALLLGFGLYRYRQTKRQLDAGELEDASDHNG